MIYRFQLYNSNLANQHIIQENSGLSNDDIDAICQYGDTLDKRPVKLYGSYSNERVSAEGSYFPLNDRTKDVYDKVAKLITMVNHRTYNYDLTGFEECFYYHTYNSEKQHHFGWHYDMGGQTPAPRKLSLSIQLSDPCEYDGGILQFQDVDSPIDTVKERGMAILFPSYKLHRVTPVTRGIRRSLIAFAVGPNFK